MSGRQRKSMSGTVQGMDAYFEPTVEKMQNETSDTEETASETELERVTLYIRPDQDFMLTELQSKLKRKRVKTNRSELIRAAIDLLGNHELDTIEQLLEENT